MISAYQTNLDSNQYPHTQAVLIRDAKYQFVRLDPSQANLSGMMQQIQPYVQQQLQPYLQQQTPNAGAPAGQQAPRVTTPTPKVTSPVPKQTQPAQPAPKPAAPAPAAPAPKQPAQAQAPATGAVSQFAQQVINLTNAQRSKNGLPALKADTQLSGVA
ncbi:CAP domain-containing protein, partial [Agrobacterium tumefaciens]